MVFYFQILDYARVVIYRISNICKSKQRKTIQTSFFMLLFFPPSMENIRVNCVSIQFSLSIVYTCCSASDHISFKHIIFKWEKFIIFLCRYTYIFHSWICITYSIRAFYIWYKSSMYYIFTTGRLICHYSKSIVMNVETISDGMKEKFVSFRIRARVWI